MTILAFPGLQRVWQNRWGKQLLAAAGGMLFFWGLMQVYESSPYALLYNDTESQPRGIYLLEKFGAHPILHTGERVDFHYICPLVDGVCRFYKEAPYKTGSQGIKYVAALPGDVLTVRGSNVYVKYQHSSVWHFLGHRFQYVPSPLDHHQWVAIHKNPKLVQPLFPKQRIFTYAEKNWHNYRIPAGYFYGQSRRVPNSFDSRYYGLDKYSQLVGKTELLWRVNLDPIFDKLNSWGF